MNILSTLYHAKKLLPKRLILHITLSAQPAGNQPAGRMLSVVVSY